MNSRESTGAPAVAAAKQSFELRPPSRRTLLILMAAILLVYAGLAALAAATWRPWSDEGWFASPAVTLLAKGYLGTPVLEANIGLNGIARHTYWIMPLYPLAQAAWYKLCGFSLMACRALSAGWGAAGIVALFLLVSKLAGNGWTALAAAALAATDYMYVTVASLGRTDMMAAGLGLGGLALYACLRERHLTAAILAAHTAAAAALFTHPNGILYSAGLLLLMLAMDGSRMRLARLWAILPPYMAGGLAWGCYILQAPGDFWAQIRWNGAGRFAGILAPLDSLRGEIVERYLVAYGLGPHSTGTHGPVAAKALIPLAYLAAIILLLAVRDLRRRPDCRILLGLTGLVLFMMTFFNQKLSWYLVHIVPLYSALVAMALVWLYQRGRAPRAIALAAFCGLGAIQAGGLLLHAKLNLYGRQYQPAVAFLKTRLRADSKVCASAELGFGMGFDERLLDDSTLGFYNRRRPDLIVVEEIYRDLFQGYGQDRPPVYQHIVRTLADYNEIYDRNSYQIYERKTVP